MLPRNRHTDFASPVFDHVAVRRRICNVRGALHNVVHGDTGGRYRCVRLLNIFDDNLINGASITTRRHKSEPAYEKRRTRSYS